MTALPDSTKPEERPPPRTFKQKLSEFAAKPLGFGVLLAFIVFVVAGSLYEVGVLLGAIVLLLMGFGFPIYLGWNRSYRNMFVVALVITVAATPIWGALATQQLFTPYAYPNSNDTTLSGSVLQNAHVHPFAYPPLPENSYHFSIHAVRQTYNGSEINVTSVGLWVTDCSYDGANSHNECAGGPDYYQFFLYDVLPANASRPVNIAFFNLTTLPQNKVIYFVFTANYTIKGGAGYMFSCNGNCMINKGIAEPQPLLGPGYWNEGPITGPWGTIFGIILVDQYYPVMAGLGGLLAVVILIYRFLKLREKRRQAQAGDAAEGTVSSGETRCPKCQAVVKSGESFCWKCGSSLEALTPDQPLPVK